MNDAFDQHFLLAEMTDQRIVICKLLDILARGGIFFNCMEPLWEITYRKNNQEK